MCHLKQNIEQTAGKLLSQGIVNSTASADPIQPIRSLQVPFIKLIHESSGYIKLKKQ